jgi:hypothetical protein
MPLNLRGCGFRHAHGDRAIVRHPKNSKFAWLRGKTTDAAGNTGEVTIIRAYKVAG